MCFSLCDFRLVDAFTAKIVHLESVESQLNLDISQYAAVMINLSSRYLECVSPNPRIRKVDGNASTRLRPNSTIVIRL